MGSAIEDYFSTKEQMFTEVLLLETSKVYSAHPVGTKIFNQNTLQSRFPFNFFFYETLHAQLEWTSVPIEIYGCFNGNRVLFQKCIIQIIHYVSALYVSPLSLVCVKDISWQVREIIYCWFFLSLKIFLRLILVSYLPLLLCCTIHLACEIAH